MRFNYYIRSPGKDSHLYNIWREYYHFMKTKDKFPDWMDYIWEDKDIRFWQTHEFNLPDSYIELSLEDFNYARTKWLPEDWCIDIKELNESQLKIFKELFCELPNNNGWWAFTDNYYWYDNWNADSSDENFAIELSFEELIACQVFDKDTSVKDKPYKFKVWDKVKVISDHNNNSSIWKIITIDSCQEDRYWYRYWVANSWIVFREQDLELIKVDQDDIYEITNWIKHFKRDKTISELWLDTTKKFIVVRDCLFDKWDILELQKDDLTSRPNFKNITKWTAIYCSLCYLDYYNEDKSSTWFKVWDIVKFKTWQCNYTIVQIYWDIAYIRSNNSWCCTNRSIDDLELVNWVDDTITKWLPEYFVIKFTKSDISNELFKLYLKWSEEHYRKAGRFCTTDLRLESYFKSKHYVYIWNYIKHWYNYFREWDERIDDTPVLTLEKWFKLVDKDSKVIKEYWKDHIIDMSNSVHTINVMRYVVNSIQWMDWLPPEMQDEKQYLINKLTEAWYIVAWSSLWEREYRLTYEDPDNSMLCIEVRDSSPYDINIMHLRKAYEQLNKVPNNLFTNNFNMNNEMNKILIEEFVTNKANRKTLKEMETFFSSNYTVFDKTIDRICKVRNKLNDIHSNFNDAREESNLEKVEKLMEEFPAVKEFITNFKELEVGKVVEEKAKEEFDVEKYFNN